MTNCSIVGLSWTAYPVPIWPCPYTHLTVFNILVTLLDLKPVDSGFVDVAFDILRQKSESKWSILCESGIALTGSCTNTINSEQLVLATYE